MSWWSCRSCFVEGAGLARTNRRSDRTGTGPLARLLLGHFHQLVRAGVSRPVDGSLRGQPRGASRSFGSDRTGERRHPTSLPLLGDYPWAVNVSPASVVNTGVRLVRWFLPLFAGTVAGLTTALLTRREHFDCVRPVTGAPQPLRCPEPAWANWDLVTLVSVVAAL